MIMLTPLPDILRGRVGAAWQSRHNPRVRVLIRHTLAWLRLMRDENQESQP